MANLMFRAMRDRSAIRGLIFDISLSAPCYDLLAERYEQLKALDGTITFKPTFQSPILPTRPMMRDVSGNAMPAKSSHVEKADTLDASIRSPVLGNDGPVMEPQMGDSEPATTSEPTSQVYIPDSTEPGIGEIESSNGSVDRTPSAEEKPAPCGEGDERDWPDYGNFEQHPTADILRANTMVAESKEDTPSEANVQPSCGQITGAGVHGASGDSPVPLQANTDVAVKEQIQTVAPEIPSDEDDRVGRRAAGRHRYNQAEVDAAMLFLRSLVGGK